MYSRKTRKLANQITTKHCLIQYLPRPTKAQSLISFVVLRVKGESWVFKADYRKAICKRNVYVFCNRMIRVRKRMLSFALTGEPREPISWLCQSVAYQMKHLLIWQTTNHSSVSKLRSLVANFNITQSFQFVSRLETRYITERIPVKSAKLANVCTLKSSVRICPLVDKTSSDNYAALRVEQKFKCLPSIQLLVVLHWRYSGLRILAETTVIHLHFNYVRGTKTTLPFASLSPSTAAKLCQSKQPIHTVPFPKEFWLPCAEHTHCVRSLQRPQ